MTRRVVSAHGLAYLVAHALLGLCLGVGACAARIPAPTEADARLAATRWPGVTLADLARGRGLYMDRCSGCHSLWPPDARTPEAWTKMVDEIAPRARLDEGQQELVMRYLVTAASRPGDGATEVARDTGSAPSSVRR